jgi:RNA polymerase sigma factor (sigma-70 family)
MKFRDFAFQSSGYMSTNPFSQNYTSDQTDTDLVKSALQGNKKSLESLVLKHQQFIYNLALKMIAVPADAEDITQEILIKMITNLSKFEGKSQFRTWLYRIVVNHILNLRKQKKEFFVTDFESYFNRLEQMPDTDIDEKEMRESIEEIKIGCTSGMLLCLTREQRMIFVLGVIFEIDHHLGAEMFEITPDNFRQKLSRAKKDIYHWMDKKCGLINKSNPCRCAKKTKAFIEAGFVDPEDLLFNRNYRHRIDELSAGNKDQLSQTFEELNQLVFTRHPFQEPGNGKKLLEEIINNKFVKEALHF